MRHDGKTQQSEPAMDLRPGATSDPYTTRRDPNATVIGGRYELCELLGVGGMGIVYRARRLEDGLTVALKVLRPEFATDVRVTARLQREAEAVRRVRHANVVELLDAGTADGIGPYLAFEYLEGGTLNDLLGRRSRLAVETALEIADQVLAALAAAHAVGVIHRDLKPENVHVVQAGGPDPFPTVKVLDFGISRVLVDGAEHALCKLTTTGTILGTPIYMAPEQALGTATQDARVDVYAAGVLLYEMLSGAVPHDGENYSQVLAHLLHSFAIPLDLRVPELDEGLVDIVHRAIEREPADRFGSVAEMREALLAWRRGDVAQKLPGAGVPVETTPRTRRPSRPVVAAGVVLSLGVAIVGSTGQAHETLSARSWSPRVQLAAAIAQHTPPPQPPLQRTDAPSHLARRTPVSAPSSTTHPRFAIDVRGPTSTTPRLVAVRIVTHNPYRSP